MIRRVKPQRVLCESPRRSWQNVYASHPDHLASGEATLCAVYPDARNPFERLGIHFEVERRGAKAST